MKEVMQEVLNNVFADAKERDEFIDNIMDKFLSIYDKNGFRFYAALSKTLLELSRQKK